MTTRPMAMQFVARNAMCAAVALTLISAAGCAGGVSIEDAVPVSAQQPVPAAAPSYPNLNVAPQPAAEQITPEERETDAERLRATRADLAGRPAATADSSAELRRLGQSHAADVLKQIEGE